MQALRLPRFIITIQGSVDLKSPKDIYQSNPINGYSTRSGRTGPSPSFELYLVLVLHMYPNLVNLIPIIIIFITSYI